MVDNQGDIVDGDEILFIIAQSRYNEGTLKGQVVGTLMSNLGLEQALETKGITLTRTKVGDRYVLEAMKEKNAILGGESSGHIICLDRTTTGDGIVTALQVLTISRETGLPLHVLKSGMKKCPQRMINVPITPGLDVTILPSVQKAVSEAEETLVDQGRVLLRPSGTEPLIRVMVEGFDKQQVDTVAQQLADVVKAETGDKN